MRFRRGQTWVAEAVGPDGCDPTNHMTRHVYAVYDERVLVDFRPSNAPMHWMSVAGLESLINTFNYILEEDKDGHL